MPSARSRARKDYSGKASSVKGLMEKAVASGLAAIPEYDAEPLAKKYGIPVAPGALAATLDQAAKIGRKLGYPVVLKISSPDVVHKTDAGGVKTSLNSPSEVRKGFREILRNVRRSNPKARIAGIYVQKMAPKGHEFVVGGVRDPQFGPTVMFGLGGIYVEIFKDVAFRLTPISEKEALGMMKELKSSVLLTGFRGSKPLDTHAAAKVVMAVGKLMTDYDVIDSIDLNPLFVYPKGVLATDVRILLKPSQNK